MIKKIQLHPDIISYYQSIGWKPYQGKHTEAWFVEPSGQCCAFIRNNIIMCRLPCNKFDSEWFSQQV
jgi:hypothetical protein